MKARLCIPVLALAIASGCAQNQNGAKPDLDTRASATAESGNDIIRLSEWDYARIYEGGGIQSDNLIDAAAFGPDGNEIGSVENVILDEQNQIIALILEVGGFWDIGDTHVAVPWAQVTMTDDGVEVPVREDNLEQYDLYGEDSPISEEDLQQAVRVDEGVSSGPRNWKLTSLLGDYATLDNEVGYGYVDNVIFSRDGEIQAVVIESEGAPYAYPFYGYSFGWDPGFGAYQLPYGPADIGTMRPFDYGRYR